MLYWTGIISIVYILIFSIKKNWIFIIWLFLALISGFRYNVGTDYKAYSQMFTALVNGTATDIWLNKEIGYLWLVDLVDFFNGTYQLVFFILSISTIILFYKGLNNFFEKNRTYLLLGTLLFIPMFYFYSLNGIRQAFATAIFFYSIKFILKRESLKYFLTITFAILFHKSALILFPLYWLLNIRYSNFILSLYLVIGILIMIFNPLQIIMDLFSTFKIAYFYYFEHDELNEGTSISAKIITFISFIIIILFSSFLNRDNPKENIIFNTMIFFILLRLIAIDMEVLNRLSVYFKPFFIVFIIFTVFNVIRRIKNSKNLLFISLIMLILLYSIYGVYYRAKVDGAYNQYAINFCLFGKEPCPLQIYGDYNDLYFKGK